MPAHKSSVFLKEYCMYTILIIILVLIAFGGLPNGGFVQHGYGWGPSGLSSVIVLVLIILLLTGRL